MPEQKTRNTYNECINQLHNKYDARGVAVSADREADKQDSKDTAAPNAFLISRMNKGEVSERYKNGEFNGQKYMTTGDFLRYYNSHRNNGMPVQPHRPSEKTREFAKPQPIPQQQAPRAPQPQTSKERQPFENEENRYNYDKVRRPVRRFDPKADTIVMPAQKSRSNIRGKLSKLIAKWFPQDEGDSRKDNNRGGKKNIPVAVIGLLISLSISMMMIVSTTVMASDAQNEMSGLKTEVKLLRNEQVKLEEELIKKDDLSLISAYAGEKLGMIRKDYVSSVFLPAADIAGASADGAELATLLAEMYGDN